MTEAQIYGFRAQRSRPNEDHSASVKRVISSMRSLQLLIQLLNQGYHNISYAYKVFDAFWFIVMTSFGIIRFSSSPILGCTYLFMGVDAAIFYCVIFHKAFAIPMATRKLKGKLMFLAKLKISNVGERRAICSQIGSIPPIGIKVGMFHTFERMSTPNFLGFGLKNIVRILIAFNQK